MDIATIAANMNVSNGADAGPVRYRGLAKPKGKAKAKAKLAKAPPPPPPQDPQLSSAQLGARVGFCCICQDDLHMGEDRQALPCSHVFHTTCVHSWMQSKNLAWDNCCPVCKPYQRLPPRASTAVPTPIVLDGPAEDTGGASSSTILQDLDAIVALADHILGNNADETLAASPPPPPPPSPTPPPATMPDVQLPATPPGEPPAATPAMPTELTRAIAVRRNEAIRRRAARLRPQGSDAGPPSAVEGGVPTDLQVDEPNSESEENGGAETSGVAVEAAREAAAAANDASAMM
jgi:hypothetical protein